MAGKNIAELDPVASLTGTELMYVSQSGVDKSATPDDIVALVPASPGVGPATVGQVAVFTDTDAIGGITDGNDGDVLTTDGEGGVTWEPASGGGSSGTLGLVQLSDGAGGFASDAGLSYDSDALFIGVVGESTLGRVMVPLHGDVALNAGNSAKLIAGWNSAAGQIQLGLMVLGDVGDLFPQLAIGTIGGDYSTCVSFNSGTAVFLFWDNGGVDAPAGALTPATDNTQDLGGITATAGFDCRWKRGYFGTSVVTPDVVMSSGAASVIILPTSDPEVVGALWNNSGTITISTGP